jgi:hypothetical protein
LAGADDADGGNAIGRFEGIALLQSLRIEPGHRKKAVARQGMAQHLPVAGLKDMQREQRLRKERHVGERHYRDFIGHHDFHFHAGRLGGSVHISNVHSRNVSRMSQVGHDV